MNITNKVFTIFPLTAAVLLTIDRLFVNRQPAITDVDENTVQPIKNNNRSNGLLEIVQADDADDDTKQPLPITYFNRLKEESRIRDENILKARKAEEKIITEALKRMFAEEDMERAKQERILGYIDDSAQLADDIRQAEVVRREQFRVEQIEIEACQERERAMDRSRRQGVPRRRRENNRGIGFQNRSRRRR